MCSSLCGAGGCSTQGLDPAYIHPRSHLSLSPLPPVPLHHQLLQALPAALGMTQKEIYPAGNACSSPAQSPQLSTPSTLSTSRAFASPGLLQAHPAAPTRILLRYPAAAGIPTPAQQFPLGCGAAGSSCWDPQFPEDCQVSLLIAGCPQVPVPRMVPATPSSALLPGHLPSQGSPWAIPLWGTAPQGRERTEITPTAPSPPSQGLWAAQGASGMGSERGANLPLQLSACPTSPGTLRAFPPAGAPGGDTA